MRQKSPFLSRFHRCTVTAAAVMLAQALPAANYYWTGAGTVNSHLNREWDNPDNWALDSVAGAPATVPLTVADDIFLINSNAYLGREGGTTQTQMINDLTVVSGTNVIGSRYTSGAIDMIVNGNFDIQAGGFYLGPYSPNWVQFKGTFTAANNTTLGNRSSTSDGGYWDLSQATAINLNGVRLNHMTNNWMFGPQVWNFGTSLMTLTNNNTFHLDQNVVQDAREDLVDSRGSLQITVINQITGNGGLTKQGDATLILNNATSDYTGATNISQGVLIAQGGNAIGDSSAVVMGDFVGGVNGGSVKATLSLDGDETIGSLAGGGATGGNVILNGHTLTMGGNNTSTTFAGIIGGAATGATQGVRTNQQSPPAYSPFTEVGYIYSPEPVLGTGDIVKTGAGTLTLSGANLYGGLTVLQEGGLTVTGEVRSGVAGPLGLSDSAIVWGNVVSPNSATGDNGNVTMTVLNNTGGVVDWTFDRGLDGSGVRVDMIGRPRFVFSSTNVNDTSRLTLAGDVIFSSGTPRYEFAAQRAGATLDITGKLSGGGSVLLWNGSNMGLGIIRLSNAINDYTMTNTLLRGTLIVAGNVAAAGPSPIGTGSLNLGNDGAPPAVNVPGGINTKPGFFMETPGTTFARSISLGTVATYTSGGITNNGVPNGYRIGGLNTSGEVTFSGPVISPGSTNGLSNLALFSEGGGAVNFTGVISDNTSAAQVTRVNINRFVNHPDLNATDGGADQPVDTATTGTVILSGANLYEGGTVVHGGTLLANNTTGSATGTGSVSTVVNSGATLGGTGSISGGTSQSITLGQGTFLMVGSSHGTGSDGPKMLTLGDLTLPTNVSIDIDGILEFDLFANVPGISTTENDVLRLGTLSTVDFTGSSLNVAAAGLDSTAWEIGDSWMLIDWSGVQNGTPFASLPTLAQSNMPALAPGQAWVTSTDSTGFYIGIGAVPEPSRAVLLFGGLALALLRRRRRPSAAGRA